MPLFAALQAACKGISVLVQRAAVAGATGLAVGGSQNAGGDQQKKLDVVSNDLIKGFLARSGVVRVLASEEVRVSHLAPCYKRQYPSHGLRIAVVILLPYGSIEPSWSKFHYFVLRLS